MAKTANILIIILGLLGFRVSIGERKWKIFAYYTQISNLITLVSSVVYGIVMMYMNYRECFDGPYAFFRVNHQSRLATVLWMAGLTGMITVIALVIRWC